MDNLRGRVDAECVLGGGALLFDVVELVALVNRFLRFCILYPLFWKLDESTFEFVTMGWPRVTLVLGFRPLRISKRVSFLLRQSKPRIDVAYFGFQINTSCLINKVRLNFVGAR